METMAKFIDIIAILVQTYFNTYFKYHLHLTISYCYNRRYRACIFFCNYISKGSEK